jgi:hypothetical protein
MLEYEYKYKAFKMLRIIKKRLIISGIIGAIGLVFDSPVLAINYGSGTYGTCQYSSCSISISSSSTVSANITPTVSGACTINNDVVSVLTDDSNGYTLTIINSNISTNLVNGGSSISSTSGTQAIPQALTTNNWGYRVDGVGGFGAGPTTSQTNISPPAILFAVVPSSSSSANTIATKSVAANPAVNTNVWYGVCANTTVPSGTYTTQITYTAVTN